MQTFWDNSANATLYKEWPGGVTEGLLVKGGLYNNKPLHNFLTTELADILPNQRFIDVGLTNVLDGTYKDFFAADLTGTELVDVMFGSFAYAGFFAPEAAMGTDWFDGSTIWDLDIFSAVNKCLETHAPEDIVVDVLLTSTKDPQAGGRLQLQINRHALALPARLPLLQRHGWPPSRPVRLPNHQLPPHHFPLS
jgi:predicted acylesterase/phospholipase RssA